MVALKIIEYRIAKGHRTPENSKSFYMKTLKQNEKYHSAGNTIKGNVFSTLFTLSLPRKTKPSQSCTQDKFYVDRKSVVQLFFKEVIAILFHEGWKMMSHCLCNEYLSGIVYQSLTTVQFCVCSTAGSKNAHKREKTNH